MGVEFGDRYRINISSERLSRGTGEQVPLREITVFDVMPQILGGRFADSEALRKRAYFHSDHIGVPYHILEDVYKQVAEEEIGKGRLDESLDAYRRSLHYGLTFTQCISNVQTLTIFTPVEILRLNLSESFGSLERKLTESVVQQEVAFHPDRYADFVREVRVLEKERHQLHQLFFFGESSMYETVTAPDIRNKAIGRQYVDTCVRMGKFSEAAWIAREMGDEAGSASYLVQAQNEPKDNPRAIFLTEQGRGVTYDRD